MNVPLLTSGELAQCLGVRCYETINEKFLAKIERAEWREYAATFLKMTAPVSDYSYETLSSWDFSVSPGSGAHHTHFGGLALHTLQNLEYADAWAGVYAARGIRVDESLLYASIIIHDTMKKFIYSFDENYNFTKAEDPFIAKHEDHHSWVLREMTVRGCDKDLIFGVAAMHGIDDVTLETGVKNAAVVNHYLEIGNTGFCYKADDVRIEHVIAFLADSDWHWSGQAQRKTGSLAELLAIKFGGNPNYIRLYLGSKYSYEKVGCWIEKMGLEQAVEYVAGLSDSL